MTDNFFVHGEEEYLVDVKVNELCSRFSDDWTEKLDSWEDMQAKLCTLAMFADRRIFIMDYDDLARAKPEPSQLKRVLEEHPNVLILISKTKPDKRTQVFKTVKTAAKNIEVHAPRGSELQQWVINRGMELGASKVESRAAAELIFLAGSNMLSLENELNKLISYAPIVTVENVRLLATRDIQTNIFELVDSVAEGNTAKALNIVEDLISGQAGFPYILQMLARQYRLLFRIVFYRQQGYGSLEVQNIMKLHPFAFKKMWQQASVISSSKCAYAIHSIAEADYTFKTGQRQGIGMLQVLTVKLAKK